MDLQLVADFNLVVKHGGFGAASRYSGQAKATLSRRVRDLESSLGVRLIERGSRPLRLTEEGAVLHGRTDVPLRAVADTLEDVKAGLGRPSGHLRISAPLLFANLSLGPLAAAFQRAYPEVVLEVTTEDRFVDLIAEDIDIVIRANPKPDDNLVGRCFLRNTLILIAPPDLPKPDINNDVMSFAAVMRTGSGDDDTWSIVDEEGGEPKLYRPKAVMRMSSPLSIRDAIRAGAGAGLVPYTVVAEDLASGRLVSWGISTGPKIEAWVLHASRRLVSPKVTAFVTFICDYFSEGRDVLL
jgi:DNA-binding transcriptional LysR family regulator